MRLACRVRDLREAAGWSQQELAARAGLSRALVSAVETARVTPSTAAALALARTFGKPVEEIFSLADAGTPADWAWPPADLPARYWSADMRGRALLYPCEQPGAGPAAHDGVARAVGNETTPPKPVVAKAAHDTPGTLVVAGCDPAAGLLAAALAERGVRLLAFTRSSQRALDLLQRGVIHAAGLHLGENRSSVRRKLGSGFRLLRVALWEEGLAVSHDVGRPRIEPPSLSRLRWVGREEGSGARECIDELLQGRKPVGYDRPAADHREVAALIRGGWADAGVCVRLAAVEAALTFTGVRREAYDLCFPAALEDDARVLALCDAVRSRAFRQTLSELPGYDTAETGSVTAA
jgi:molybdate-binding protein/DNA-binding XRE family transcriptional regulator